MVGGYTNKSVTKRVCPGCGEVFYHYRYRKQICCSISCAVSIRPYKSIRDKPTTVTCEFKISKNCRGTYTISNRAEWKNRYRNDGKLICLYCSRELKFSGRSNPNTRHKKMNDRFFEEIDTVDKAYLLGWIASDGHINRGGFVISINKRDIATLKRLRDIIDAELSIWNKEPNMVGFCANSMQLSKDLCRHLKISPGKKSDVVQFPDGLEGDLKWAFMRGYFEGDGCVTKPGSRSPKCEISSNSPTMVQQLGEHSGVPYSIYKNRIEWSSLNALDFLGKIYEGSPMNRLDRKYELFLDWYCWVPALSHKKVNIGDLTVRVLKTRKGAVYPAKTHTSDSGYDVTLLEKVKSGGKWGLYTTGLKIAPPEGWYFDLVPRSSLYKTGYILANSIGVIDRSYRGEILAALVKIDEDAPDLVLPAKVLQIVPRPIAHFEMVEVDSLGGTKREEGGFGSTGQ